MKNLPLTTYYLLLTKKGQSMAEYLLVVFLISFAVFQAVQTFGRAIDTAFAHAIINIAVNIK